MPRKVRQLISDLEHAGFMDRERAVRLAIEESRR